MQCLLPFIQSKKGNKSLTHYTGGLVLTSNEADISNELEEVLEEADYIHQIFKEWELLENNEGPSWKKD